MASMTEPRELFLHELRDILFAENLLVKTLPKLAGEVHDEDLRSGLEHHLEETRGHVKNLEKVFAELGEPAKGEECPAMEGLVREHDKFVEEEQPAGMICDMFVTGAGAKTEHYEIAAYSGLVESAMLMGQDKVAGLLQENLDQEKAALKTLESAKKRLSKEAIKNLAQA